MRSKLFFVYVIGFFTIFLLAGCSVPPGFGRKTEVESREERIFSSSDVSELIINNDIGNIQVQISGENEIKFEIIKRVKGFKSTRYLQGQLQDMKAVFEQVGGQLNINTGYDGPLNNIDGLIDLAVYIPSGLSKFQAKLNMGNLRVRDLVCTDLSAELNMGNAELLLFEGRAKVNVNMGNIIVNKGRLLDGTNLITNMGNIDIRVTLQDKGEYSFVAGVGNIDIKLPSDTKVMTSGKKPFYKNEFEQSSDEIRLSADCDMGRVSIVKY